MPVSDKVQKAEKPQPAVPPPAPPERPCALDAAPINSKLVVVIVDGRRRAVLMTPEGERPLASDDVAHVLPDGARIQKQGDGRYVAEQLNPAIERAPRVSTTARDACLGFTAYFHAA